MARRTRSVQRRTAEVVDCIACLVFPSHCSFARFRNENALSQQLPAKQVRSLDDSSPVFEVGSPPGVSVQRQVVVSTVIRTLEVPGGIVAVTGLEEVALERRSWPRHW